MKSKLYEFDINNAYQDAYDFMVLSGGFDVNDENSHRILDECVSAFESVKDNIHLRALVREFPTDSCSSIYFDSFVNIEGESITCNAFHEIDSQSVKSVFAALITAGDWSSDGSMSNQVYLDLWGTAFVDSAKILLEKEMKKSIPNDLSLSDPFGPGYYGMPTDDTKKIARILDSELIGVSVKDSGIMIPEKTIAAIYLVTDKETVMPPVSCSECFGSSNGCKSCDKYFK